MLDVRSCLAGHDKVLVPVRPTSVMLMTYHCMQATAMGCGITINRQTPAPDHSHMSESLLTIQLQAEHPQTPLIAQFLPPDLPRVADLPLQGIDVTSGALAFELSHDRIAEAFDRLQDDIQQWSAALVDSPADVPDDLHLLQPQGEQSEAGVSGEGLGQAPQSDSQGDQVRVTNQSAASEQGSADTAGSGGETGIDIMVVKHNSFEHVIHAQSHVLCHENARLGR